jgi:hypothetical protein
MSACAAASLPRSAVAFASGAALAFFGAPMACSPFSVDDVASQLASSALPDLPCPLGRRMPVKPVPTDSTELRLLALADIRKQGFRNVDIRIEHVTNQQALCNFAITVISHGDYDRNAINRAAIYTKHKLAHDHRLQMPAD